MVEKISLQLESNDLSETERENLESTLENYKMQVNLNKQQLENLKYETLYSLDI
jgi:hypothetical protein